MMDGWEVDRGGGHPVGEEARSGNSVRPVNSASVSPSSHPCFWKYTINSLVGNAYFSQQQQQQLQGLEPVPETSAGTTGTAGTFHVFLGALGRRVVPLLPYWKCHSTTALYRYHYRRRESNQVPPPS